jgi:hypothetical protein
VVLKHQYKKLKINKFDGRNVKEQFLTKK